MIDLFVLIKNGKILLKLCSDQKPFICFLHVFIYFSTKQDTASVSCLNDSISEGTWLFFSFDV